MGGVGHHPHLKGKERRPLLGRGKDPRGAIPFSLGGEEKVQPDVSGFGSGKGAEEAKVRPVGQAQAAIPSLEGQHKGAGALQALEGVPPVAIGHEGGPHLQARPSRGPGGVEAGFQLPKRTFAEFFSSGKRLGPPRDPPEGLECLHLPRWTADHGVEIRHAFRFEGLIVFIALLLFIQFRLVRSAGVLIVRVFLGTQTPYQRQRPDVAIAVANRSPHRRKPPHLRGFGIGVVRTGNPISRKIDRYQRRF
ncbi:MAG: hypothetical protein BWY88_00312 [Synergistetes bacterium ADurb.Bin520]|nr:MAG: hypothetical protein BWY88_00312 [Synergistetes bacterium ADurb.Bin520]